MNRLAWMLLHASVLPSTSVAFAHCSHFADFSVLCLYEHFAHSALATPPHPITPLPTYPLSFGAKARTCFIARTMLAITFLSSITMGHGRVESTLDSRRVANTFRWFTLIKLMEWNACVLALLTRLCSTRLQFFYFRTTQYPISLPLGFMCRNLHFWQRRHTPRQEVVYKELHLKAALRMCPCSCPAVAVSSLRAHMQFLWLVSHRNGLLLKASNAPLPLSLISRQLSFPFLFFFWRCFAFFG